MDLPNSLTQILNTKNYLIKMKRKCSRSNLTVSEVSSPNPKTKARSPKTEDWSKYGLCASVFGLWALGFVLWSLGLGLRALVFLSWCSIYCKIDSKKWKENVDAQIWHCSIFLKHSRVTTISKTVNRKVLFTHRWRQIWAFPFL